MLDNILVKAGVKISAIIGTVGFAAELLGKSVIAELALSDAAGGFAAFGFLLVGGLLAVDMAKGVMDGLNR